MTQINIFYEHIFEASEQSRTGASCPNTPENILKLLKGEGIDGLECDLWRLSDRENVKELFERVGMRVASVYNMFDFPHDDRSVSLEKIRSCLETAAYFGAEKVLAIPGFVSEGEDETAVKETIAELLSEMCGQAKKYGIKVSLEDYDDKSSPNSTITGLEYFVRNVPELGVTFDTGNFAYSLESAEEAYERLKPYIVHVHLKDRSYDSARANADNSNGKADLSGRVMYPCEVGEGFIGIEGIVKRLVRDGYGGSMSIEHFGAVNQVEYAVKSVRNVRKFIEEAQK
jgi:sugar phosphate isomerase/epimerase